MGGEAGLSRGRRHPLTKICHSLRRHQARMHYDEYLVPDRFRGHRGGLPAWGEGPDGAGRHALDGPRGSSLAPAALCGA
jgi:hypothetical protein